MSAERLEQKTWRDIPGKISNVKLASKDILTLIEPLGFSEAELFDIRVCVEEALSNAIKHGSKGRSEFPVSYSVSIAENTVEIRVKCSGSEFDPGSVADPTTPQNMERGGGRGVFLMRKLMDDIVFEDGGETVTMIKHRKNA